MIDDQIEINLPKGGTLFVRTNDGFMEKVKNHFDLDNIAEVDHDHIRMFIYGALKTATEKAEEMGGYHEQTN